MTDKLKPNPQPLPDPEKAITYNPTTAYIYARRRQKQRLGVIPRG